MVPKKMSKSLHISMKFFGNIPDFSPVSCAPSSHSLPTRFVMTIRSPILKPGHGNQPESHRIASPNQRCDIQPDEKITWDGGSEILPLSRPALPGRFALFARRGNGASGETSPISLHVPCPRRSSCPTVSSLRALLRCGDHSSRHHQIDRIYPKG